jgi:hypothetical protein
MNLKARQRIMRSFLASLLQSDLDESDLRELADDLAHGDIGIEMGELIREAMLNISDIGRSKKDTSHVVPGDIVAYDLVNQRRLPKKFVYDVMALAAPWMKTEKIPASASMRELLKHYFNNASDAERRKFLTLLQGESVDPYLKGISRRS